MHSLEIADLSDCDKIQRCIAPRFKEIPTIPSKRANKTVESFLIICCFYISYSMALHKLKDLEKSNGT
jgi:hypothetical protein